VSESERDDARCIAEPVSWLRLEQYLLDELPPAERALVATHLRACPACAAAETEARQPVPVRALGVARPRLSARIAATLFGTRTAGIASRMALVAATAAVLVLARAPASRGPGEVDRSPRADETLAAIKGGEVAVELVRERAGVVEPGATTFAPGDRWKVLVTCPSGRIRFWDLGVREGEAMVFPLAPGSPLICGNRVPLPEALRISGTRANDVCLFLSDAPPDRARATALGPAALAAAAVCLTLRPEPVAP